MNERNFAAGPILRRINYAADQAAVGEFFGSPALAALIKGDCREVLHRIPQASVDCVITSPPYWHQRDYHVEYQERHRLLGNEISHLDYVKNLVDIFAQVKRTLKSRGSLWLNLGDKYVNKNLMGLP